MQTPPSTPTSVPGQYYGYSIQSTRQCLHLLLAPAGSVVALEVLDDTDVVQPDDEVKVEQSKSGLATNPISDWSVDLWKTFSNWIDAIEAGYIELARTHFHLYVVQPKNGDIADLLKFSHTPALALTAVQNIKKQFKKEKPAGCKPYVDKFLAYDQQKLAQLIVRFTYECGDSDPVKPIKDILRNTVPEIALDDVCYAVIGWVKTRSDELIGSRKHAGIEKDAFAVWLSTHCTKLSYEYLLTYTVASPEISEVEENILKHPVMMHQLDLIERSDRDKLKAMADFMRSKNGKTRWAEHGFIVESQFKDFEEDLGEQWEAHSLRIKGTATKLTPVEQGQSLFLECRALRHKINGKEAPDYFSRGTFQSLANNQKIGWHPAYKLLLSLKLASNS